MTVKPDAVNSTDSSKKKKLTIGIPRGLFFFKYAPLWKAFLEYLNCNVVFSQPTSTKIVEDGSKDAISELCIPMKIYFGHVKDIIDEYGEELDYLFIPRYVSTHADQFFCPKFMILPEAIKYGLKFDIPIITLEVNAKKMKGIEGAVIFGKLLGFNQQESGKAWYFAFEKFKAFKEKARKGNINQLLNKLDTNPKHVRKEKVIKQMIDEKIRGKFPVNILVLGHAYNVYETHINLDLMTRLKAMDANVLTMEQLPPEVFKKPVIINKQYHNYWENEEEIMQTARYYLFQGREKLDGIIFLISFACGPDSLIQELVMRDMKKRNIPFLAIILDEHSGESGLVTRIESFVDMIRREKFHS
jgi:predicted nucleotide-binding protein (sugar kinase/HSP70/actin superfamily)